VGWVVDLEKERGGTIMMMMMMDGCDGVCVCVCVRLCLFCASNTLDFFLFTYLFLHHLHHNIMIYTYTPQEKRGIIHYLIYIYICMCVYHIWCVVVKRCFYLSYFAATSSHNLRYHHRHRQIFQAPRKESIHISDLRCV
jgi:hypothetical protein